MGKYGMDIKVSTGSDQHGKTILHEMDCPNEHDIFG